MNVSAKPVRPFRIPAGRDGNGLYSFLPEERAEYGTGIINMGGHGHGGMVQQKNPVALPG